ncbi:MAG TPA: hypothetical protein VNH22_12920 [Blastocatellia bacterium]|nr:hypothetical protein [Blastocatellia bacterium]
MKKYPVSLPIVTLVVVFSFAGFLSRVAWSITPLKTEIKGGMKREIQHDSDTMLTPEVLIVEQVNSPVLISVASIESATAHRPHVELTITNRSAKPIRAIAIRYDTISMRTKSSGVQLSIGASAQPVLRPGHSKPMTIGENIEESSPIRKLILSVDLVEFSNGSTWGIDTYESRQRLEGMRAGTKAEAKSLLQLLESQGADAVLNAIAGPPSIPSLSDHSAEWVRGYQTGINIVRSRLQQAKSTNNNTSLEREIRHSLEALKGGKPE